MKVEITTMGDWEDTIGWLDKLRNRNPDPALEAIGKHGVGALEIATPRDLGITANSWSYKVNRKMFGADIAWYNYGRPYLGVNLVLLKQFGHGTGTGGYVPPFDFINPAMSSIFEDAGDLIVKELLK